MSKTSHELNLSVERPLAFLFRYLSDFSHLASWAPSCIRALKTTPGAVGVGTHFDIVFRAGRSEYRLDYVITQIQTPYFIEAKGKGESFSIIERLRFEESEGQSHLQYQVEIYYQETASLLAKTFAPIFHHARKKDLESLKAALNHAPSDWHPSLWTRLADRLVIPGMLDFSRSGYTKQKHRFRGITHDLTGKRILITGPTSGIGMAIAKDLARLGAQLIFVARNERKVKQLVQIFEQEELLKPEVLLADISLVEEIEEIVAKLKEEKKPLDAIINNAGALFNERLLTREGIEMSFATLLLGPYVLTEALHPLLKLSSDARVINISSGGMYTQALALDDIESSKDYQGDIAYARAKRGLVDLTEVWAERWEKDKILVHSMHPGWTDTPGVSHSMPKFYNWTKTWLRTPEQAADTVVWLVASQEAKASNGLFWLDRIPRETGIIPGTKSNPRHQQKLFEILREYHERLSEPKGRGLSEVDESP